MNKKYALPAIVMFAVIMGISAIAPDAFAKGPSPKVVEDVCHFDRDTNDDGDITTDDRAWEVLTPNTHGAQNGHVKHGDKLVPSEISEFDCLNQADPDLPV